MKRLRAFIRGLMARRPAKPETCPECQRDARYVGLFWIHPGQWRCFFCARAFVPTQPLRYHPLTRAQASPRSPWAR